MAEMSATTAAISVFPSALGTSIMINGLRAFGERVEEMLHRLVMKGLWLEDVDDPREVGGFEAVETVLRKHRKVLQRGEELLRGVTSGAVEKFQPCWVALQKALAKYSVSIYRLVKTLDKLGLENETVLELKQLCLSGS